jgi:hypothetical protein
MGCFAFALSSTITAVAVAVASMSALTRKHCQSFNGHNEH